PLKLGAPLILLVSACGGDDPPEGESGELKAEVVAAIELAVDADRDGVVSFDSEIDRTHGRDFQADRGAAFLANLDDDDANGVPDFMDEYVDPLDEADLAPLVLAPWHDAPDGVTAAVTLSAFHAQLARVWKKTAQGGWEL